ncbi:MAG: glycosyltransferase family 4 protein [Acidimicrobiales bacterium]|nr:glycosyltransferase family 4 protein [Acidimicrobiales bacterium]
MIVGFAKPDWGVTGGFEVVLDRLADHLTANGHSVVWLTVPGTVDDHSGDPVARSEHPEFFDYSSLVSRFGAVDASGVDVVVTTQPGSWAVDHPRKVALFYHHQRIFYDLSGSHLQASGKDPEIHEEACRLVRELDSRHFGTVEHFLVPSHTVEDRLIHYSGIDPSRMSLFLAGPVFGPEVAPDPDRTRDTVVCVSRSEFTKRTQLFVAAAHEGFDAPAVLIGGGGQLPTVRRYAAEMAAGVTVAERAWDATPVAERVEVVVPELPVDIVGRLSDDDLRSQYSRAVCLVAPALNEDYGLTVLEAFAFGVPVVVCRDGGGLVEFVDDGVNGFVVDPEPEAVANAVRLLTNDANRLQTMSLAARATAERYTWQQALDTFDKALIGPTASAA